MTRLGRDVTGEMVLAGAALLTSLTAALTVRADTLNGALIKAYQNNPQLNSQRAIVRETDESVPQALSGYRPAVSATLLPAWGYSNTVFKVVGPTGVASYPQAPFISAPTSAGGTVSQSLFNAYETADGVRQA